MSYYFQELKKTMCRCGRNICVSDQLVLLTIFREPLICSCLKNLEYSSSASESLFSELFASLGSISLVSLKTWLEDSVPSACDFSCKVGQTAFLHAWRLSLLTSCYPVQFANLGLFRNLFHYICVQEAF